MGRNIKIWIGVILVLAAGLWYVQHSKSRHESSYEKIFNLERDAVHGVEIRRDGKTVELTREGDTWRIAGNDSLVVRENRMDDLFNQALAVQRGTVMTTDSSRWDTYSVGDSTGIRLTVKNASGKPLGEYFFGQSKSDWSRSYVRVKPEDTVYLTDKNVTFYLNTTETYWGQKPPAPEAAGSDSVRVEVDPPMPVMTPKTDSAQVQ